VFNKQIKSSRSKTNTLICASMRFDCVRLHPPITFVFLFSLHLAVYSQWIENTKPKHLFGGRDDGVALIFGNEIFAGTGMDDGFQIYSDWSSFNISSNTWSSLQKPPFEPRQYTSATVNKEHIFLFGGYLSSHTFFNDVWKYLPQNDTWQVCRKAPFSPRWASSATTMGSISFLACGRDTAKAFNDFWAYNPESDSWQKLPDFPGEPRFNATLISMQGHLYLGFGQNTEGVYFNDMYVYSPFSNTWSLEVIKFPETRSRTRAAVLNNRILFFNGRTNEGNPVSTYTVYQTNGETQSYPSPFPVFSGFQLMQQNTDLWLLWGLINESKRSDALIHFQFQDLFSYTPKITPFPNPGADRVVVGGLNEKKQIVISVHTLSGNLVDYQKTSNEREMIYDTSSWPRGVYVFLVENEESIDRLLWVRH
jgi:N-acetylneuraminic acid mutarotase